MGLPLFDIKLSLKLYNQDIVDSTKLDLLTAARLAAPSIKQDFYLNIVFPLIWGGQGWYGIHDTPTWAWLNSEDGYAQMGFTNRGEPISLLNSYLTAWECDVLPDGSISWSFGDTEKLIKGTIHPAAGKGNLSSTRSWFEWLEGLSEPAKFTRAIDKRRANDVPGKRGRAGGIAGDKAGIMTKYKKGLWAVPDRFQLDIDTLLSKNERKIERELSRMYVQHIQKYLN